MLGWRGDLERFEVARLLFPHIVSTPQIQRNWVMEVAETAVNIPINRTMNNQRLQFFDDMHELYGKTPFTNG